MFVRPGVWQGDGGGGVGEGGGRAGGRRTRIGHSRIYTSPACLLARRCFRSTRRSPHPRRSRLAVSSSSSFFFAVDAAAAAATAASTVPTPPRKQQSKLISNKRKHQQQPSMARPRTQTVSECEPQSGRSSSGALWLNLERAALCVAAAAPRASELVVCVS